MTLTIAKGRGYVTAGENIEDIDEQELGLIAVDSIYSPVTRVRYATEDARVGQKTDYDRLILEIWTNGTVTPEMALVEASKILRKHLNPFVQYFELGSDTANDEAIAALRDSGKAMIDPDLQQKLDMTVQELDLSVRRQQLPGVGQDRHRPRAGEEDRRRPLEGPQLRQDQPPRGQAQVGRPGSEPGHGPRPGGGEPDRRLHRAGRRRGRSRRGRSQRDERVKTVRCPWPVVRCDD
jgi:hypothetical protein